MHVVTSTPDSNILEIHFRKYVNYNLVSIVFRDNQLDESLMSLKCKPAWAPGRLIR